MTQRRRTSTLRTLLSIAVLLPLALIFAWSCGSGPLAPFPGAPEALGLDFLPLPVGNLNVAGGNFLLPRTDLTIDTRLGTQAFGATWNSATGTWRWSTDLTYDGATFIDASGAIHDVSGIQPGKAIPGTHWRVVDTTHLKTKGGLVHGFGSDGRLEEIHWSGAAFPDLRLLYTAASGARQLVTVEQCTAASSCSPVFDLAYDGAGNLTSVTDRAGRVADYSYDAAGQLVAARDPVATASGGPGIRYLYANGRITEVIDGDDEAIDLAYNGDNGRKLVGLTQVGEEDPSWTFSYVAPDANGRYRTSVRDPLGNVTKFFYDSAGHLLELDRPSGAVWTWTWSGARIATSTDPRRATTTVATADDDPVEITTPAGNVVDISYQPDAENRLNPNRTAMATLSDSLGTILQATYDAAGRLSTLTNGAGETRSFSYDSLGQLATSTTPSGYTTHYGAYGEDGHPTSFSSPAVSATAVYDAVGNLLEGSSQTPDFGTAPGGVVSRSFDPNRRLQQEVLVDQPPATAGSLPGTATLRIDRRADGRPLAIHRPYGGESEFVYDTIGRLVAQRDLVDGAWQTTTITRDALGRPVSVARPNGMELARSWNADGQLATSSRLRNGSLEATASYTYVAGLLASIQDSVDAGTESYEREASGRIKAIHYASGETLEIQYDLRGRDVQDTYRMPGAEAPLRTLGFTYDGANRIQSVLDGGMPVVTHTFGQGRISRIDYGNGLSRTFSYDATSNLVHAAQTLDASGNVVESTSVSWQILYGNLLVNWTQTLPVLSSDESYFVRPTTTQAGDESGGRILAEIGPGVGESDYSYDALSNVTDRSSTTQSRHLVYNAEHERLLSILDVSTGSSIHTYRYDAAGFVTQRDGVGISWTADGRISGLGSAVKLSWDLEGRLVSMDIGAQTKHFLFGGRVETDAAGAPQKLLLGEAQIDLTNGSRLYRHFDFRGNVAFVTDSSGAVVQAYDYDSFGVRTSYGPVTGERSFAQGRLLNDLVMMGSRLYDPSAARFLSPDPVFQLVNQYAYAMANPIQFWDPGGTSARAAAVAAGVVTVVGGIVAVAVGGPLGLLAAATTLTVDIGIVAGASDPKSATSDVVVGAELAMGAILTPLDPVLVPVIFGAYIGGQTLGAGLAGGGGAPGPMGAQVGPSLSAPAPPRVVSPPHDPGPSELPPPAGFAIGVGGGPAGIGGGGGGGGGGSCTATALSQPRPALAWLWLLGPLQVGLGAWLLRAARASSDSRRREE